MQTQTVFDVQVARFESYDTLRVRHLKDMPAQVPTNFERLKVTITEVASIERPQSGKLKRFVAMSRASR
jgi:hypothetical protein